MPLSIQVPLSNFKKRDKTYKPENVGVDKKVGASVFLRVSKGKDGKMDIAYDPLKKLKKKKKKKTTEGFDLHRHFSISSVQHKALFYLSRS